MAATVTVDPANGEAVLFTQGGPGVSPGYNAVDLHRMMLGSHAKREGVFDQAAWKVRQTTGGPSNTVEVDADLGIARVDGTVSNDQGEYIVAPHSGKAALTITTAHATLPRIDSVVLQVRDTDFDGSGVYDARVVILTGTPSSGATLDNRAGAPSRPPSSLHLADLRVDPTDTTISDDQIRDFRPHAGTADIGDIKMSAASTPPPGWKLMDGTPLNRAVHSRLYAAVGDALGAGDGSVTFLNLADARGRTLVHEDGAAARLSANDALGQSGGFEKHTLGATELPSHTHPAGTLDVQSHNIGQTVGWNVPTANTSWQEVGVFQGESTARPAIYNLACAGDLLSDDASISYASGNHDHPIAGSVGAQTGTIGQPHNNMPPYLVAGKYVIYSGSLG